MTRSIFSPTWMTSWVLMMVSYPADTTDTFTEEQVGEESVDQCEVSRGSLNSLKTLCG